MGSQYSYIVSIACNLLYGGSLLGSGRILDGQMAGCGLVRVVSLWPRGTFRWRTDDFSDCYVVSVSSGIWDGIWAWIAACEGE